MWPSPAHDVLSQTWKFTARTSHLHAVQTLKAYPLSHNKRILFLLSSHYTIPCSNHDGDSQKWTKQSQGRGTGAYGQEYVYRAARNTLESHTDSEQRRTSRPVSWLRRTQGTSR